MTTFRRTLGLFDTTSVVIGAIIGVGIFFTPSDVARLAGSEGRALAAWGLGGVVALLGAFTFAELGRRFPRAGGQYDVLREAWGSRWAFLYAFCVLTAVLPGSVAVIARIAAFNLSMAATGEAPGPTGELVMALALTAAVVLPNAAGVQFGAGIQNLTVVIKVAVLVAIAGLAVWLDPEDGSAATASTVAISTPAAAGGIAALFVALIPALFSYGGWQQALWMGGEVKEAERNLPRAIVLGVVIVVAVYLAAAWAFFHLLGYEGVVGSRALAAQAVGRAWPGVAERVVALAVGISAFGVLNVQFLTGPRLIWAMSADDRFFPIFARVSPRTATPVPAILLLLALSLGVLAAGTDVIGKLTAWVVVVDAFFFGLTGLALLRLGARAPRWLLVAGGFALLEFGCVVSSFFDPGVQGSALAGLGWVGAALVFGFVRERRAR